MLSVFSHILLYIGHFEVMTSFVTVCHYLQAVSGKSRYSNVQTIEHIDHWGGGGGGHFWFMELVPTRLAHLLQHIWKSGTRYSISGIVMIAVGG